MPQKVTDNIIHDIHNGTNIAVATTGTAYSNTFELPKNVSFGWEIEFESGAAVDVVVTLEQSNEIVATEGAADANYAIPDGAAAFITITNEITHIKAYAPAVSKYARLKFVGQGSNAADTVVSRARMVTSENS